MPHKTWRVGAVALSATLLLVASACTNGDDDSRQDDGSMSVPDGAAVPGTASATHVNNPYASAIMYVNEDWSANVRDTADDVESQDEDPDAELADAIRDVANTPTAVWMDSIGAIEGNGDGPGLRHHLDAALEQGNGEDQMVLTLVIYDLPGRDCSALVSNGELPPTDAGLADYENEYIGQIAAMLAEDKYQDLRVAAVIEPDSLPNLVANESEPKCQTADPYYRAGVTYALDAFAPLDNVYSYIDAGNSGWLGWDETAAPTVQLFADVVSASAAGFGSVDGFITNTANYTPLDETYLPNPEQQVGGEQVSEGSFYESNLMFDESDWAADLYSRLVGVGFPADIGMVIDTSRNGWGGEARATAPASATSVDTFVDLSKVDARTDRGAWCNQEGAGLGPMPQALPDGYPDSHLDAFVWVKPPGESDGASSEIDNDEGKTFNQMCDPGFSSDRLNGNATNAMPDAPLYGTWFTTQFAQLVQNAYPAVGDEVAAPREDADANKARGNVDPGSAANPASPSTSPTATATPEVSESAEPTSVGCTAELSFVKDWTTGFETTVTVTADAPITGWALTVTVPEGTKVIKIWRAQNEGDSGTFVIRDVDWNGTLAAGESVEFGFVGDGAAPPAGPLPCQAE
jgi:cellulose 1,4-beta-cellobiosidase